MRDQAFEQLLQGYSLTTAEILYKIPDHRGLLQMYLWQEYDLHPCFPKLEGFLHFWATKIDGPLHSVRVMHRALIQAHDFKYIDGQLVLH